MIILDVVVHHLSHRSSHTTGCRALTVIQRTLIIVGCSLVPSSGHQYTNITHRTPWSGLGGLVVDRLQILHLVDVALQEDTHVIGHVLLVEVTDVAIAQHGLEALVTTHQHEAILQSGTDGIEVGLSRHVLGIEHHCSLQHVC